MEKFIPINEFEDYYEINKLGIIKNVKSGKILKGTKDSNGYMRVVLCGLKGKKHLKTHRLVAQHFLDNPNGYSNVLTIKGKSNPELNNLKWVESAKDKEMDIERLIKHYDECDQSKWRDDQKALLKFIKTNDSRHIGSIYKTLYDVWLGHLIKITKDEDVAMGILHESYESFITSLTSGRYRIDRGYVAHSIDIYIKRLIRNSCTNYLRKNKKDNKIEYIDDYWENTKFEDYDE